MPEVTVTLEPGGGARVSLVSGPEPEVRDSVGLDELEACGAIAALENLVLDFDHYGRLVALRVLSGAGSALSPSLLEHPGAGGATGALPTSL